MAGRRRARGSGGRSRRVEEHGQDPDAVRGGLGHVGVVIREVVDARAALDRAPVEGLVDRLDADRRHRAQVRRAVIVIAGEDVVGGDADEPARHPGVGRRGQHEGDESARNERQKGSGPANHQGPATIGRLAESLRLLPEGAEACLRVAVDVQQSGVEAPQVA